MHSQITSAKAELISKKNFWPFLLLTTLFMLWGVAHNMTDTLLAAFKRIMSMTDFQTSWIQLAFYGSYFCLALPAAVFIRKYTYKSGILLGLGLFAVGSLLFYPAGMMMSYGFFLLALYVLAGGLSILETAANPYILVIGPPETATQRLNLAQSFNPIGSVIGVYLSKVFILSQLNTAEAADRTTMDPAALKAMQADELAGVVSTYVGVAIFLVLVWFVIRAVRMPIASETVERDGIIAGFKRLSKNKNYVRGVMAQFFYVGAQIGVWSFTIRYVMDELDVMESGASDYYLVSLILFAASRFLFTALMKFFKPSILLAISSLLAIVLSLVVIYGSGMTAVVALVLISVCMSLMFPTIYGLSAEGLGNDTKLGGSGLIMAILGGALITAAQGQVSDLTGSIHLSYYVPVVCFAVVMYFGISHYFHKPPPKSVEMV
ncbi:MFS transporter, FHS family, L-fucose permease [Cyclobacterium xiamenense]|uniref:MFS transporter, FHS family, L-fucose permease n=1 Tax=Cyclobacterium xiamenense TaxID=1297121 RepID=A0A1H6Z7K8_9BACT|nr:L-fucose:H+ symporter permease [Cyclobacterium xiamenense]SEJ45622.1 MFS transporter, FHS family, L-fucose permease [Cyclobacterium xiamenense]